MDTFFASSWRTSPIYTYGQAARLAGVSSATVRRWLYGYESPGASMRPVFGLKGRAELGVEISFLELIEIVVVGRFRARGVSLERLRRAHRFARDFFNVECPFASIKLKTDGAHVLHDFEQHYPGASLVCLDQFGQLTLPNVVNDALYAFDFEDDLAARWYPEGRGVPIVVDPRFGAGLPTIPSRRVTVAALFKRWSAGQSVEFIAQDYDLGVDVVERVVERARRYAA